MKRLIIHGGIHRTGSTSLQKSLAKQRAALEAHGVAYPGAAENHQDWAWALHRGEMSGPDLAEALAGVAADAVLLSAEDFARLKSFEWLDALRPAFAIEAHFFLRRQDEWLMSWYNQTVRWPFNKHAKATPQEFLENHGRFGWLHYHKLCKAWAEAPGVARVRVYRFDATVTERFLASALPGAPIVVEHAVNGSSPPLTTEFLRHLDLPSLPPGQRVRVVNAAREALAALDRPEARIYPPETRRRINAPYRRGNALAFERFGAEGETDFDYEIPDDAPFVEPALPETERLMAEFVAPFVRRLARK
ncbi:MAG: hypothetical protein AAFW46_05685 [Pseudomonadota bacterium]